MDSKRERGTMQMSASEFYRMPAFATLTVIDPPAAAGWYTEVLGFRQISRVYDAQDKPGFVHVRRERYQDLLLVSGASGFPAGSPAAGRSFGLTFRTEEDLDELAARAYAAGALIIEGPVDKPWNAREVTVQDPDGHRITFSNLSWISGLF